MLEYRKLTRHGQLTLPQWFREKHHLEVGDLVELVEVDEGLLLKPLQPNHKKSAVQQIIKILDAGSDKIKGMTEDELLTMVGQEIKGIRLKNEDRH